MEHPPAEMQNPARCLHGAMDRCDHCCPDFTPRLVRLQNQLPIVLDFTVTATSAFEWLKLLSTLVIEAAELGFALEELIEE